MKKVMFDSEQYPDFTYENNGVGTVKVQVSAANQAFPSDSLGYRHPQAKPSFPALQALSQG